MVHALNETWRVTRAEVLDVRPLAVSPLIYVRDKVGGDILCGELTWCGETGQHHLQSDVAWARAQADLKFALLSQTQFDWYDVYETATELIDQVHDEWLTWTIGEDVVLALWRELERAGRGAVPYIRQPIGIKLWQKIYP